MSSANATIAAVIEVNKKELGRLIFLLQRPEQTGVFWVNCDSNYIKQPLQEAIAAALPTTPSATVHLTDENTSMVKAIAQHQHIQSGNIVHVMGIEHAAKNGDFPFWLNLERSALFSQLGCYFIIWGDHSSAASLSKKAYDFWSWLFNVFEFTTPPALLTERQKGFDRLIELSQQTIPIPNKDSAERIRHLEFQYRQFADALGTNPRKIQIIDLIAIAVALAEAYREEGKYEQMIDLLQPLWDRYEATLELVNKVSVLSYLGAAYKGTGSYEQAKSCLEQAMANSLMVYGASHPSVATAQSNLGTIYQDLGDLNQAKHLLEKALETHLANYGANHPSVVIDQSILASVYQELGDLERAKQLLEIALESDIANYGANHPSVAIRQSNLATVYRDLGDLPQAKHLLEQALATKIASYGANDPSVAITQSNLAMVYRDLGDFERAKVLLEQALATGMLNYRPHHPSVATRQHNLAWILFDMEAFSEAKVLASHAYETRLQLLGADHRATQSTKELLDALKEQGY